MTIKQVITSNTFLEWINTTNDLANSVNSLNVVFNPGGIVLTTVTINTPLTSTNTALFQGPTTFSNTVSFQANVTFSNEVTFLNHLDVSGNVVLQSSPIYYADGTSQNTAAVLPAYSASSYDKANSANVLAQAAYTKANSANVYAQSAFNKANAAVQLAFTTINANGVSLTSSSNTGTLTFTSGSANGIVLLANNTTGNVDVGLANSGATPATYGNTTHVPIVVVDKFGRVTSASNSAIAFPPINTASNTSSTGPAWSNTIPIILTNGVMEIGRYLDFHATSSDAVDYAVRLDGAGANNTLNLTGNFVASGDVSAFSDERIKSDIQVITDALNKLQQVRGVTFLRTDTGDTKRQTGVIAQELQTVLPEAVSTDERGYLSVAYGNVIGLLIEAIKELKAEVDELKNKG